MAGGLEIEQGQGPAPIIWLSVKRRRAPITIVIVHFTVEPIFIILLQSTDAHALFRDVLILQQPI